MEEHMKHYIVYVEDEGEPLLLGEVVADSLEEAQICADTLVPGCCMKFQVEEVELS
jgi:hypothetical protein